MGVPPHAHQEKISGRRKDNRDQLQLLLQSAGEGDMIVITKLDRMARNTKDALDTIEHLKEKGISLVILNMGGQIVDTSTPIGKMLVTMLAAVAESKLT
ncbi:recombinase family protein [Bacillus sp. ISL-7]|nr:recombinase family protein [Bacillus sp. ISL-7]